VEKILDFFKELPSLFSLENLRGIYGSFLSIFTSDLAISTFALIIVILFGIVAIVLSVIGISGTWVVIASMIIFKILEQSVFPSWWLILFFTGVAGFVELIEFISGKLGVKKYGGSKKAETAGLISGIIGGLFGGFLVPIPIVGSLIGMLIISFIGVYYFEYKEIRDRSKAAYVAWGSVVGRVFVVVLKLFTTLVMFVWTLIGIFS